MAKKKVNRPSYGYDQQAAMVRNAKVPYESAGIMRFDPTTGSLNYPNLGYSNVNPEMRYFNPYLQQTQVPTTPVSSTITPTTPLTYDPTYANGNPEMRQFDPYRQQPQATQPTWDPRYPVFEWDQKPDDSWELVGTKEGVPQDAALGVDPDWSSTYHPSYYKTAYKQPPLTAIWGGSNKGTMGTRGWRRPGSSYLPEQQVYQDANGNVWAERPEFDKRSRWQKYIDEIGAKKGNNQNVTISGAPVTWRT